MERVMKGYEHVGKAMKKGKRKEMQRDKRANPMGMLQPSFIVVSMSSRVPRPLRKQHNVN